MLDQALSQLIADAVEQAVRPLRDALDVQRQELEGLRHEVARVHQAMDRRDDAHDGRIYFTVDQIAKQLGVSTRTVRRWIDGGLVQAARLPGGGLRIRATDLDGLLTRPPTEEAAE